MLDREWLKTFAPMGVLRGANQWQPTGACVFILHDNKVWCVTAAHVVTAAADRSVGCMVTVNAQQTVFDLTEIYRNTLGTGWLIDEANDVAAGPLPMPPGIDVRALTVAQCIAPEDLVPSMPCLTAGHPYGLPGVDPARPTPLLLDGVVAGLAPQQHRIFVSVPTFPGNSGGPIFVHKSPWTPSGAVTIGVQTVFLAGIVTETIVVPNEQLDRGYLPPLHLGSGATMDVVKKLLTRESFQETQS